MMSYSAATLSSQLYTDIILTIPNEFKLSNTEMKIK